MRKSVMTETPVDAARDGVILESINSIARSNRELSSRNISEAIASSQAQGLRLRMALLTRRLRDLKNKEHEADAYLTKLRSLASEVRSEHAARCERLRQRDYKKSVALAMSLPRLEESLDYEARTLRELNNAIQAEEERNRRIRGQIVQFAEARLPDTGFAFTPVDEFKVQSEAFVEFLKFLDPSLGEEDTAVRQTRSSDSESPASGYTESEPETSS